MNELVISTYIQILQEALIEHNKQEAAGSFLLDSIAKQEIANVVTDLSAKKISRLVHRQDPVPDDIKCAALKKAVQNGVYKYFENKVLPDLNPYTKFDALLKLHRVIEQDTEIADRQKNSFYALYNADDQCGFLVQTFLYSLQRKNKNSADRVEAQDIPLLAEVNYVCPLTQTQLVVQVDGIPWSRYTLTHIFPKGLSESAAAEYAAIYPQPENLDSPENLIALCNEESDKYELAPSPEKYKQLYELKHKAMKFTQLFSDINRVQLEEEIRTILAALQNPQNLENLPQLEYTALRIDEKISDGLLRYEVRNHVVQFYRFIETTFSEKTDNFDEIAASIKKASRKLEAAGLSQKEVIEQLSEWVRKQTRMDLGGSLACHIMVSFFIQNCEVFYR